MGGGGAKAKVGGSGIEGARGGGNVGSGGYGLLGF